MVKFKKISSSIKLPGNPDRNFHDSLIEIFSFWKGYNFDKEALDSDLFLEKNREIKKLKGIKQDYPVKNGAKKEYVVGDVHGDLNHLLYNLIASGVANFTQGEPEFTFFDTQQMKIVSEIPNNLSDEKIWSRYRMIPNLKFNPKFSDKIVFLGDILDRGVYSDECVFTLINLCQQEKSLGLNSSTEKKLNWVFADHELYALNSKIPIQPNYEVDEHGNPSEIALLGRKDGLKTISSALNHAIKEDFISYAHIGSNGVLYSHSFITSQFLGRLQSNLKHDPAHATDDNIIAIGLISRAGIDDQSRFEVIRAIDYLINFGKGDHAQYDGLYYHNLNLVVNHCNNILKFAAQNPELYAKTITKHYHEEDYYQEHGYYDSGHPLFSFSSNILSPIITREQPLPIMGAVGHNNQSSHNVSIANHADKVGKIGVKAPIYVFDQQASYAYSDTKSSSPSLSWIDKNGNIGSTYFKNEKNLFKNSVAPKIEKKPQQLSFSNKLHQDISNKTILGKENLDSQREVDQPKQDSKEEGLQLDSDSADSQKGKSHSYNSANILTGAMFLLALVSLTLFATNVFSLSLGRVMAGVVGSSLLFFAAIGNALYNRGDKKDVSYSSNEETVLDSSSKWRDMLNEEKSVNNSRTNFSIN